MTQLSFVGRIRLSESILPSHMIRLHRQECGQMDSFVPKKKSAAESVTPEVLVNLRHRKTTHTLPGEVVQGVFKKFTRFRADKYNRLYTRYVKNACNTVYRITKVINFPQSATTCLYWGRAAESIAEKRLWGLWSPYDLWCVPYDLRTVCLALPGFTKQAASRREAACLCCLWNAYSLRGVTLTYDLPAPFLQNSTVPSTRAKSV